MARLWFKAKKYGWGWYPVSWQGWIIVAVFAFIIGFLVVNTSWMNSWQGWFVVGILLGVLLGVCRKKGEKPRWRWG